MTDFLCHCEAEPRQSVLVIANAVKQSVIPLQSVIYLKQVTKINYYVYILSNSTNVAIYTGVTKNLIRRVYEHKNNLSPNSHTAKYNIHKLVYFETTTDINSAISREKQIKSHSRKWKNDLIDTFNPEWQDLYESLI